MDLALAWWALWAITVDPTWPAAKINICERTGEGEFGNEKPIKSNLVQTGSTGV
jgi:hypothetical protein